jgi:hypothetical protein
VRREFNRSFSMDYILGSAREYSMVFEDVGKGSLWTVVIRSFLLQLRTDDGVHRQRVIKK